MRCVRQGFGLAWAIAKDLAERARCFTLFATHFLELSALEGAVEGVKNYHVKAAVSREKKQITFLYEVQEGHADQSYGVHVAQFAGLPEAITQRAAAMSEQLEAAEKREKRRSAGMLVEEDLDKDNAIKRLRGIITHAYAADTPELFAQEAKEKEFEIRNCLKELQHRVPQSVVA